MSTWTLTTADGRKITEAEGPWPTLPTDLRIARLVYRPQRGGAEAVLAGYEAYGFQRYGLTVPGAPSLPFAGAQIIGVRGDQATIIDVNEITGAHRGWSQPVGELTYARHLLRPACSPPSP